MNPKMIRRGIKVCAEEAAQKKTEKRGQVQGNKECSRWRGDHRPSRSLLKMDDNKYMLTKFDYLDVIFYPLSVASQHALPRLN